MVLTNEQLDKIAQRKAHVSFAPKGSPGIVSLEIDERDALVAMARQRNAALEDAQQEIDNCEDVCTRLHEMVSTLRAVVIELTRRELDR